MKTLCSLLVMLGFVLGGTAAAAAPVPAGPAALQTAGMETESVSAVLLSSVECAYPNCTDPAHCHSYTAARYCRNRLTGWRHHQYFAQTATVPTATAAPEALFWNCMGCTDPNCTDPAHFHHCAAGCTVAEHYHDCPAGCASAGHHHGSLPTAPAATAAPEALFWNSMGCTDPNCTDPAHFHHCAAGCTVAGHYHDCLSDCTAHAHGGYSGYSGYGSYGGHHGGGHHGGGRC